MSTFRILPDLKNLDVVTTPRVPIELCRKMKRPEDRGGGGDDDSAQAGAVAENRSSFFPV